MLRNALIFSLGLVISYYARHGYLNLARGKPGFASSQTSLRARHISWEIKPSTSRRFVQINPFSRMKMTDHMMKETNTVITPSTINSHFHPSSPDLPRNCKRPLAISPLTALAMAYVAQSVSRDSLTAIHKTYLNTPEPRQPCRKLGTLVESTKIYQGGRDNATFRNCYNYSMIISVPFSPCTYYITYMFERPDNLPYL
jgi:hypothetical protein